MADNQSTTEKAPANGKQSSPQKSDFDFHVLLIMRQDGVSKSKATFMAWAEGPTGIADRLSK